MPKHAFILWLTVKDRLMTRSRILKFQRLDNSNCLLCDIEEETRDHLFFKCSKSMKCLQELRNWLGWRASSTNLLSILRWIQREKVSKFKKKVYNAMIAALVYVLWHQRNLCLWKEGAVNVTEVIQRVKNAVQLRGKRVDSKCNIEDQRWFIEL